MSLVSSLSSGRGGASASTAPIRALHQQSAAPTKVYLTHRVGSEAAGLKLTAWMKKNVMGDWRRLQHLYKEKRVYVVPEGLPVVLSGQEPVEPERPGGERTGGPSSHQLAGGWTGESLTTTSDGSVVVDEVFGTTKPEESGGDFFPGAAGAEDLRRATEIPQGRKSARGGTYTPGHHILEEGDTIIFPRTAVVRDESPFRCADLSPDLDDRETKAMIATEKQLMEKRRELERSKPASMRETTRRARGADTRSSSHPTSTAARGRLLDAGAGSKSSNTDDPLQSVLDDVFAASSLEHVALQKLEAKSSAQKMQWLERRKLFEDTDFLILNKPAGIHWGTMYGTEDSLLRILQWYEENRTVTKRVPDYLTAAYGKSSFEHRQRERELGERKSEGQDGGASSTEQEALPQDRTGKTSALELIPTHRLPEDMAGCMVIAKNKAAAELAKQSIRDRSFWQLKFVALLVHPPVEKGPGGGSTTNSQKEQHHYRGRATGSEPLQRTDYRGVGAGWRCWTRTLSSCTMRCTCKNKFITSSSTRVAVVYKCGITCSHNVTTLQ